MTDTTLQRIDTKLAEFARDPVAFMHTLPAKMDADGNPIAAPSLFDAPAITLRRYVDVRDEHRDVFLNPDPTVRAPIANNDRPENLVDLLKLTTLQAIADARLTKATLNASPWSDDYWPTYKGLLGWRYADPRFPAVEDWRRNFNYVQANPATKIFASGNANAIDLLSPSEKYDALIGDTTGSLTQYMWREGKNAYDQYGKVETWMGICHGWAPAAYMLARPQHAITVKAANGLSLHFYPADIKALASLLWANASGATRFIGGRCNDKAPATDPTTGRITSNVCFDTNPGAWHLSLINQIGIARRSLVLDATYDYEVWNQPVFNYDYRYFNPRTQRSTNVLEQALIKKADYPHDPFKQYRSPAAVSLVGIAMKIGYVVETKPTHRETDNPAYDAIQYVEYLYDLELDATGKIIGGEWYNNAHPDFLWTPIPKARALSTYDNQVTGEWDTDQILPPTWRTAARSAAQAQGTPLAAIVEHLIRFANATFNNPNPNPRPSPAPAPNPNNPMPNPRDIPVVTSPVTPAPVEAPAPTSWWRSLIDRILGN